MSVQDIFIPHFNIESLPDGELLNRHFLDPECFRPDSMLGVPGLMGVYQKGGVALANAPGGGVADDQVIYAYVPRIVKYYLGEDIILPNVPTYICSEAEDLNYVLAHLDQLSRQICQRIGWLRHTRWPALNRGTTP